MSANPLFGLEDIAKTKSENRLVVTLMTNQYPSLLYYFNVQHKNITIHLILTVP